MRVLALPYYDCDSDASRIKEDVRGVNGGFKATGYLVAIKRDLRGEASASCLETAAPS